jgi:hypothetical protein
MGNCCNSNSLKYTFKIVNSTGLLFKKNTRCTLQMTEKGVYIKNNDTKLFFEWKEIMAYYFENFMFVLQIRRNNTTYKISFVLEEYENLILHMNSYKGRKIRGDNNDNMNDNVNDNVNEKFMEINRMFDGKHHHKRNYDIERPSIEIIKDNNLERRLHSENQRPEFINIPPNSYIESNNVHNNKQKRNTKGQSNLETIPQGGSTTTSTNTNSVPNRRSTHTTPQTTNTSNTKIWLIVELIVGGYLISVQIE